MIVRTGLIEMDIKKEIENLLEAAKAYDVKTVIKAVGNDQDSKIDRLIELELGAGRAVMMVKILPPEHMVTNQTIFH